MAKAKTSRPAKAVSLAALIWLASSYLYPLHIGSVQVNAYPELYLIPLFGLWRLRTEQDAYQRKRVLVMIGLFFLYWVLIPAFYPTMPFIDGTTARTVLAVHMVGSLPFFLLLTAVFFLGKRVDCGWNCPCVFDRETIGFAFRDATLKGDFWWGLRHLKWILFVAVWAYFVLMLADPAHAYDRVGRRLYDWILVLYYASFLIIPFTGHRSFCRWGCPWSATWGVLNLVGFYRIKAAVEKCKDCGVCEAECDMGVPIRRLIRMKGELRTTECMGCARCVNVCPQKVLTLLDVRHAIPTRNLSPLERTVRIAGGLTVAGLVILDPHSPWGYLGLAFFLTGIFGFCPTYALVGKVFGRRRCGRAPGAADSREHKGVS
ncbi:MAG: DUF2892 domain-containing protein [Thermoanaerobacterales bacterium]|nr:DUF2892 domain-containing protein [Thermoanaerobacterales bacterium]